MSTKKSIVNAAYTEDIKKARSNKKKSDTEKTMQTMGISPDSPEGALMLNELEEQEAARDQGKKKAKSRAAAAGKAAKAPTGYRAPRAAAAKPAPDPEPEQQPEPEPTLTPEQQQRKDTKEKLNSTIPFVASKSEDKIMLIGDTYKIPRKSRKEPKNKKVQLLMYSDLYECAATVADLTGESVNDIFAAAIYKLCLDYNAATKED